MTFEEIQEFAHALEIQSVSKFTNKEDLIRTIQLAEGNNDCFNQIPDCAKKECQWHNDCLETEVA